MVPVLKRCRSLDLDPIYLGIAKKSKKQPANSRKKISEYGLQMREKQKAKFIYGVLEKQFRGYYAKAEKMAKKEEKISRTQELSTVKIQALKELNYTKMDNSNANEVIEKILEILAKKS